MVIFVFDLDGTLTPARKPMEVSFLTKFKPWLKDNCAYIATGSDLNKVKEQIPKEILNSFTGIFCSMGNEFWRKDGFVYQRDFEPEDDLIECLENYRVQSTYPYNKFSNYIEKRVGALNFSVLGRDCSYEDRERYYVWDCSSKERVTIQKELQKKFPKYAISLGGKVSIDIVKQGFGKGQIAEELRSLYPENKIIFFGDKTFEGGNDYDLACALKKYMNTEIVQVESPKDVLRFLNIL